MSEGRIIVLASVPMLAGALLLLSLRRPEPDVVHHAAAGPPRSGAASPASRARTPAAAEEADYLGVVVAGFTADIGSEFGGSVTDVWAAVGDHVEAEAKLLRIDPRSVAEDVRAARARLQQQRSAVERARVELSETRDVLARLSGMRDGVSERALVAARAAEQQAKAALAEAEAGLGMQRVRLGQQVISSEKHLIRAPFEGVVVARFVDPGDVLMPGQVALRVISEDHFVRFAVPTAVAARLAVGESVRVRSEVTPRVFAGVIRDVAPEVDAAAQRVFVRAELTPDARGGGAEGSPALIPGLRVRVQLLRQEGG